MVTDGLQKTNGLPVKADRSFVCSEEQSENGCDCSGAPDYRKQTAAVIARWGTASVPTARMTGWRWATMMMGWGAAPSAVWWAEMSARTRAAGPAVGMAMTSRSWHNPYTSVLFLQYSTKWQKGNHANWKTDRAEKKVPATRCGAAGIGISLICCGTSDFLRGVLVPRAADVLSRQVTRFRRHCGGAALWYQWHTDTGE